MLQEQPKVCSRAYSLAKGWGEPCFRLQKCTNTQIHAKYTNLYNRVGINPASPLLPAPGVAPERLQPLRQPGVKKMPFGRVSRCF